jgi:hypothetical protein
LFVGIMSAANPNRKVTNGRRQDPSTGRQARAMSVSMLAGASAVTHVRWGTELGGQDRDRPANRSSCNVIDPTGSATLPK